ncbi:MAG: glycosyltransferase [Candidatus Scalindua sp.]|nr:glycosyltransferase [Candidatus Scalindua sp.]
MKVALVHDWLTGMRGGEKVLEVFCELFPRAHVYTLLHSKGSVSETIENMDIRTSFVQKLPLAGRKYRSYLPLFPAAIEKFDFGGYDLVLSSSHCVAKGVITGTDTLHICYCFTPMRYIWDLYDLYFGKGRSGFVTRIGMSLIAGYLRKWDVASSKRVNKFVSISRYIEDRIKKCYGRESEIIYPPVDCSYFNTGTSGGDFYLMVSPLAPNKRVDIAIKAFNKLGIPIKIIGSGQEEEKLRKLAGKNIELMGWQSDEVVRNHYVNCKALIFPGVEDFGIVPLEAQACGKPVIAYGHGGVLDTIIPFNSNKLKPQEGNEEIGNATGMFFYDQNPDSLLQAVELFENSPGVFNKEKIRKHTESFDRLIFKENIKNYIEREYNEFRKDPKAEKIC